MLAWVGDAKRGKFIAGGIVAMAILAASPVSPFTLHHLAV